MKQPTFKSPYASQYTRTGKIDMTNKKPFRTKEQKALARKMAEKTKDGYFVSKAPRSYHKAGQQAA